MKNLVGLVAMIMFFLGLLAAALSQAVAHERHHHHQPNLGFLFQSIPFGLFVPPAPIAQGPYVYYSPYPCGTEPPHSPYLPPVVIACRAQPTNWAPYGVPAAPWRPW